MKPHISIFILVFTSLFLFIGTVSASEGPLSNNESNISSNTTNNSINLLNGSNPIEYEKNELLVRFKPDVSENVSQNLHFQTGATVLKEYDCIKGLQLVKIPDNISMNEIIGIYMSNTDVLYAEPNYIFKTGTIPNDLNYTNLWGLEKINASAAWDITTGSSSVVIAVVDTGIDLSHPDLKNNIWTNDVELNGIAGFDDDGNGYIDDIYGWNFITETNNVTDDNGHGTHVAGIIAAIGNNTNGVVGVVWNAKIMPLKFLDENGTGDTDDAVDAINYAAKMGAHIINNSWGGDGYSQVLKDAIDVCNALVICAAGNSKLNIDSTFNHEYPASYTSNNLISVAATDENDVLAYFSNYGKTSVDVAAPGCDIYSTYPESSYKTLSGTSMATPYVSGLAALIKSIRPYLNNLQIKNIIINNVDKISSLSTKILSGGRINAYKCLNTLLSDTIVPQVTDNPKGGTFSFSKTITLSISENGTIYYSLDGTIPLISSTKYTGPIIINSTTTLKFFAVDDAGNPSVIYNETYIIDTIKPTVMANSTGGFFNSFQNVLLTATDNLDSNPTIYYTTDGIIWNHFVGSGTVLISDEGTTSLKFYAVDSAGNPSTNTTYSYTIDKTAPTGYVHPTGGLFNSSQSVLLTAIDNLDSNPTIFYTTDGINWNQFKGSRNITITDEGTTKIEFYAVDNAGNPSAHIINNYIIDKTPPEVTAGGVSLSKDPIKVVLSSELNAIIYYTTDGINWNQFIGSGTVLISDEGTTSLKFYAVDSAGNPSTNTTYNFTIDKTAPILNASPTGIPYYSPQNVVLAANEQSKIYYTLNNNDPTTSDNHYISPISITTSKFIKFFAIDDAGNPSKIYTENYLIYSWTPYSYQVSIQYRLSNKKYRVRYLQAYTAKKRIKIGKRKYITKYVTKYRWRTKMDYRYGYRTETRWDWHWQLT